MINLDDYERILIIRLSAIGDVIETLPAVHALRKRLPRAYIGWVLENGPHSLLQGHPDVDRFFLFPKYDLKKAVKKRDIKAIKGLLNKLGQELKAEGFDLVIDMHNLFKSGVVSLLSGAKKRVGYDMFREGSKFFLTDHLSPPAETIHFVDRQMELMHRLGVTHERVEFLLPEFKEEEETVSVFTKVNNIEGKYFCLAPGTSWPTKCWTPQGMAQLADRLNDYGRVVIIGSERDRLIAEDTIANMQTAPVNALGKLDLRELAVLLRKAELYIGGDTGPMHLAVAVGTKVAAWFGPTSPEKTGPYQEDAVIIKSDHSCQPCFKRKCKTAHCLSGLGVETVWDRVKPLLK